MRRALSIAAITLGAYSAALFSHCQSASPITISKVSPSIVQQGDVMTLEVNGSTSDSLHGVTLGSSMFGYFPSFPDVTKTASPYTFSVTIPNEVPAGVYSIVASGLSSSGAIIKSAPVSITVDSPLIFTSLRGDPQGLLLNFRGDNQPVTVYGLTSSGRENVSLSPQTQCQSSDPTIIAVNPPCSIVALKAGTTSVLISRLGLSTTVPVVVNTQTVRGDLNGDGVVDLSDVALLNGSLNTTAIATGDDRDLNGDGKIDALDARLETTLCTYSHCATQP